MGLSKYVKKRVLITVKTYPHPHPDCREVVCIAGVVENEGFIRLFPIGFRDLDFEKQYRKYEWIEVECRERPADPRKESYAPNTSSIKVLGHIGPSNNWEERQKIVMPFVSPSIEYLQEKRREDNTSLGIIKPNKVTDFIIEEDEPDWPDKWKEILKQRNLLGPDLQPLPKIPYKFSFKFTCNDNACTGHKMMISDWEVGALYNNLRKKGDKPDVAAEKIKKKFYTQLCSDRFNTHFFVGTTLSHQASWIILGLFYPKNVKPDPREKQMKLGGF